MRAQHVEWKRKDAVCGRGRSSLWHISTRPQRSGISGLVGPGVGVLEFSRPDFLKGIKTGPKHRNWCVNPQFSRPDFLKGIKTELYGEAC